LRWICWHVPGVRAGAHVLPESRRILEEARRFYQVGRFSGSFKVGGKIYKIDSAKCRGGRDHSWV